MTTAFRVCSKCRQVKPLDSFYRRGDGSIFARCKNCSRGQVHAHEKAQGHTVYGGEYDATPIPAPTPGAYALLQTGILAVMSPAELDAWIAATC